MVLKVEVPADTVQGGVDEGYGPVADAFRRNFAERGEIGAACAVYRDGHKVVDLWGGYHGITLGWYEGELIRRVDPQRRTLGRYFADEVAGPLGLDFFIGLPDDVPPERVARIHGYQPAEMLLHVHEFPPRFVLGFLNPRSLTYRTFGNPRITGLLNEYNRRELQRAEIPAANGIGTARAVARAYGEFATGGGTLGLTAETLDALKRPAVAPSGGRV